MKKFSSISYLLLVIGFAWSAGCRVFDETLSTWKVPVPEVSAEFDNAVDALEVDNWRMNTQWSSLQELPNSPVFQRPISAYRWIHPNFERTMRVAAEDGVITPAALKVGLKRVRTGGHVQADQENDDALRQVNSFFSALSRRSDLSGWNAVILWAQIDPRAAVEAEPVLSRLVRRAPSYRRSEVSPMPSPSRRDQLLGKKKDAPRESADELPEMLPISPNMQAAAAEAWCRVLAASHDDPEQGLVPAGRAMLDKHLSRSLRDELMRGIARHVPPERIPRLVGALIVVDQQQATDEKPNTVESRRAAIEACLIYAVHRVGQQSRNDGTKPAPTNELVTPPVAWPEGLWELQHDTDPAIRMRFGEFTAITRPETGFSILKSQLSDQDLSVREAALVSLGILDTPDARAELEAQMKSGDERPRMFAIRGLSLQGPQILMRWKEDKSPKVRAEIARCLQRYPSLEAARLIREFLGDRSLEVQNACLEAVADWPDRIALPLLLHAFTESSIKTRKTALGYVNSRRHERIPFSVLADPETRARQARLFATQWSLPDTLLETVHELSRKDSPRLDRARLAEWQERFEQLPSDERSREETVQRWIVELHDDDLPVLERLVEESSAAQREILVERMLPAANRGYEALRHLRSADLSRRRTAAQQLARAATDVSLTPVFLILLHDTMKTEQDGIVWRSVMQAIQPDASDEAARLGLLAINHTWPDVRVLGCEYVARHGRNEHAVWLLPLLEDPNRAVQLAAVTAAGQCRNPIALDGVKPADGQRAYRGLRPLLAESQGQLHQAVVVSMSRLGDVQAMQELIRMAQEENSTSRLEIVRIMGDSGQTRFVEPLVRLAWTEPNPYVRQAALAGLQKLVPTTEQPAGVNQAGDLADAVELWTAWWENRVRRL